MNCGFSKSLIRAVVCQKDNTYLKIDSEIDSNEYVTFNGYLICPKCRTRYEIKNGILHLKKNQDEVDDLSRDEIIARDKEADGYDKRLSVRYSKEIPSTLKKFGHISKSNIIEYGCGTGRLTIKIADKGRNILACDFSIKSLLILSEKLKGFENVGLVLGDATQFKTADNFFDIAFSAQFYEHIPNRDKRFGFLKNVDKTLKDKGLIIATIYHFDLRRRLNKLPQEGRHSSGIFFHYFTSQEIKEEFKKYFKIIDLHPIDITLPFEARYDFLKPINGLLSRTFERVPLINRLGHLLIVKARKKMNNNIKNIKHYSSGLILPWILPKYWFWFFDPSDIKDAAMVNFFSYNNVDQQGFYKKEGLTSIIDLGQNLDVIWSKMRKKFICKQIKRGERNGIVVKQDNNFKEFKKVYKSFRKEKGLARGRFSIFKNMGSLFSAYYQNRMVAGGIFVSDGVNIRALVLSSLYHTSDSREREIIGQANRMVIWEAIKFAKESGHKIFDLGGGALPKSNQKDSATLAEFKAGFGGEIRKCYYYHKVYSRLLKSWMRLRGYKNV